MATEKLCTTVGEIKAALRHLPDDMTVSFSPITAAWLGTMNPMRFGNEINFYTDEGKIAAPYDPGARCSIFLFEDRTGEQE